MKLIQRLGYYLGGFALGLIILAFFFNKKRTSCSYGPEARVLKNINSKKIIYGDVLYVADSTLVKQTLKNGSIDFSTSDPRHEPCGVYVINDTNDNKTISITLQNCDSLVNVLEIKK